jgi:hypothetical protein
MNTQPSKCFEKGTLLSPRNPNSQRRESALWILESKSLETDRLEKHITELLEFVESKASELTALSSQCLYDVFCGFSPEEGQHSVILKADLLRRLEVVPVDLVIDILVDNL